MHEVITLPNGARLVTQAVPGARTAALGFFVAVGSRHEGTKEAGAAHFVEHMLFKGTERQSALELAREIDAIGGQVNAYTTKECTCYYARCLDSHLDRACDLLCDILLHSRFDEKDTALERGVILEEIDMYEDTPEELCADRLSALTYKGDALGRPILGRASTLRGMTGQWLRAWQAKNYTPGRIVAALSGSFSQEIVARLKHTLGRLPAGEGAAQKQAVYRPGFTVRKKAIEQNHLILAFPALSYLDKGRYALMLMNSILGGGVSSRLFQQLREQQGLCYSVYSYLSDYADTGLLGIYTALGKQTEHKALETILRMVDEMAREGPTSEELERAREQAKANVIMGLESVQARMSHIGTSALLFDRVRTAEEILADYQAVTRDEVQAISAACLDRSQLAFSAVGRVGTAEEYRSLLEK